MIEPEITQRELARAGQTAPGENGDRTHAESYAGVHANSRAESRATAHGSSHNNAHVVHGSLVRPTLTLGVERHVASLEFTLCLALVLGIGVHLPTVCFVAVVALLMHPTLVWLTARDPLATQIYVRSPAYADYYAPHASAHAGLEARVPRSRPSLPRAR